MLDVLEVSAHTPLPLSPFPTSVIQIKDLTENGEYEFRVRAVNEAGESDPSMCTHPIKIKPKIVGDFPVFS